MDAERLHTLYRFFDVRDRLLYVGITCNPGQRLSQHRDEKDWWRDVARISMEQYGSRTELRAAERSAIEAEKPLHNIHMNRPKTTTAPTPTTPTRLACGLKLNEAYALGLDDGECPVGVVVEGDEDGVVLALYDWMVGMFCGDDLWVSASSITRWKRAEKLDAQQKRSKGHDSDQTVFLVDPLGDFQTQWTRRAKLLDALNKAEW